MLKIKRPPMEAILTDELKAVLGSDDLSSLYKTSGAAAMDLCNMHPGNAVAMRDQIRSTLQRFVQTVLQANPDLNEAMSGMDLQARMQAKDAIHPHVLNFLMTTFGLPSLDPLEQWADNSLVLLQRERLLVPAGFSLNIGDPGLAAFISPRSGSSLKFGLSITNSPGIIDSDYQGPIGMVLENQTKEVIVIKYGERCAQMVFKQVERPVFMSVTEFSTKTDRAAGGFGSTGEA